MKVAGIIIKIVVALAAIAGAVYLAATYGDKIVAWAKKLLGSCKCCTCETVEAEVEAAEAEVVEEAPEAEEAETPVEETAPVAEDEVVAGEGDFEV